MIVILIILQVFGKFCKVFLKNSLKKADRIWISSDF